MDKHNGASNINNISLLEVHIWPKLELKYVKYKNTSKGTVILVKLMIKFAST